MNTHIFQRSLRLKFMLVYGAMAVISILVLYLIVLILTVLIGKQLAAYHRANSLEEVLISYVEREGSLDGFSRFFAREVAPTPKSVPPQPRAEGSPAAPPAPPSAARTLIGALAPDGSVIAPFDRFRPGDKVPSDYGGRLRPVIVEDEIIASIYINSGSMGDLTFFESPFEKTTLSILTASLPISLLIGSIFAGLIGTLWSYLLSNPLMRLNQATTRIMQGELGTTIEVDRQDEIGQLIKSFNHMSDQLAHTADSRKTMTAEIAQSLNAPLQAGFSTIYEIRSGRNEMTLSRLESIVADLQQMDRLIEDLNLLSQVDTNRLQLNIEALNPYFVLNDLIDSFAPEGDQQGVQIEFDPSISEEMSSVLADPLHLRQALNNLLKYSVEGERITFSADHSGKGTVTLLVRFFGKGIQRIQPTQLFEQFAWSRSSEETSSPPFGLEFLLSKGLIEAMGGEIQATTSSDSQSTAFNVMLQTA